MRISRSAPLSIVTLLIAAGCSSDSERVPAIGEAFVGPATLNLRKDIPLQSGTVAVVNHGDRLEIIQQRRRFLKVRTEKGAIGWTDERSLMSAADISELKELSKEVKGLPSQGQATSFDALNVHTDPERSSASYFQLKGGEKMDVLGHVVAPRASSPRKPILPPAPKKEKKTSKKKTAESRIPKPPVPAPPGLPTNWLDLSKTPPPETGEAPAEQAQAEEKPEPPPVLLDDWSLIRNRAGQVGWVLTSRLYMAIPDEVAQYAEGKRITGYFPLGSVQDGDQVKYHWLWTTISERYQSHDFDSFRVFIWSMRRHRYETAYIDRNVKGYFPVLLQNVELAAPAKARGAPASTKFPGFSVCVEKRDGQRYRRNYAFVVNVVRFAGETACGETTMEKLQRRPQTAHAAQSETADQAAQPGDSRPPAWRRLLDRMAAWRKETFGR